MKRISMLLVMAGIITLSIGTHEAFAGRISDRQIMQQKRIHQGIRSGELTRCEIRRLEREQFRIHRLKKRAWRDGWLSTRERLRLERRQDLANRHIYRLKHNNRIR